MTKPDDEELLALGTQSSEPICTEKRVLLKGKTDISSLPDTHSYVWKEFTPMSIQHTHCLARTWSEGRGGQCKLQPMCEGKICLRHSINNKSESDLTHGLVTGPIPS